MDTLQHSWGLSGVGTSLPLIFPRLGASPIIMPRAWAGNDLDNSLEQTTNPSAKYAKELYK